MANSVLIVWLVVGVIWDVLVFGAAAYLIFWRGRSGWWFFLALALTYQPTLFAALKKHFGLPEKES